MNAEVQHNGIAMMLPQYIFPGLVFGAIVLMDERLELAMGMHFANNLFGALTISNSDSTLQANTIWSVDSIVSAPDIVMSYVMQLAVVVLLYKVYKWDIKKLYK
jgi:membrane protease YdiL (CAAX protease family)